MNIFSKILTSALAVSTIVATAPRAEANNVDPGHMNLVRAIRSTGTSLVINDPRCDERPTWGWYSSKNAEIVICQEYRRRGFGYRHEVNWSAEDFDTLRHEAQHLIQDCMDGRRNGRLESVYNDPIRLAKDTLSGRKINWIINDGYAEASDHVKVLELEAFSVAALNQPVVQAGDIRTYCF